MPRHLYEAVETVTESYTAELGDNLILANGTLTVTLPAMSASTAGREYTVKNIGTGTVTVDGNSTETIDGSLTAVISTQYESITVTSDGSNWHII